MENKKPLYAQNDIYRIFFYCGIITCLTFIAFYPSLDNDFTNWDDGACVTDNPDIKSFAFYNLVKVFSSKYQGNYQPLVMLTYMAEYRFFHLNAAVYHATNLILHGINGLLVFALFYILFGNSLMGLLVAVLFAVHPLRVESVAWIAERKDVLSGVFYFLSLLFYMKFTKNESRKYYWLCAGALLCSLLSKPMAVSQPLVLLCIDYLRCKKIDKKSILNKAPFFAAAAALAVLALVTQKISEAAPGFVPLSLSVLQRICIPFYGLAFYVVKSIVPVHLCAHYPFPASSGGALNMLLFVAPFPVIGAAVAVYCFRVRSRTLVFGALFFLITALPVLQIVPIGNAIAAERYTYIPALGIYCITAALLRYLLAVKFAGNKGVQGALVIGFVIASAIFSFLTHERCTVWKDSLSLWTDVISKHPFAIAYNNRGVIHGQKGDNTMALDDFNQALALEPLYAPAYFNRANVYLRMGEFDRSIENNTRAIAQCPQYTMAYYYRGIAYCIKGKYDRGIADFTQTIALDPKNAEAYFNRGLAYEKKKDFSQAAQDYTRGCLLGDFNACQQLKGG